jgi:chorismate dehydratase
VTQIDKKKRLRIGAVQYLNAQPLTWALPRFLPEAALSVDVPSRLAESLVGGRLDVGLIPSIELARLPNGLQVGNACIACGGPAWSVRILSKVPPEKIRRLALDEGSRTSAALAKIFLAEKYDLRPDSLPLPLELDFHDSEADAVLVIGDRGMASHDEKTFPFAIDLGEAWSQAMGLPFVFAVWGARSDLEDRDRVAEQLDAVRDEGIAAIDAILADEAVRMGFSIEHCRDYLTSILTYRLGEQEILGLRLFYAKAAEHGLLDPDSIPEVESS